MSQLEIALEHAERKCRQHGTKLTLKRKRILSILLQSKKALSAYELANVCEVEFNTSLPVMSIYRILQFLESQHLAHKLNIANKYVACAFITSDETHDHSQFLICQHCQKVKEISMPKETINELCANLSLAGFSLLRPQLEMDCVCSACESELEKSSA